MDDGVKYEDLPLLNTQNVSSADEIAVLDVSDGVLKRTPVGHSATSTQFGAGTASLYGHVKLEDGLNITSQTDGLALSAHQGNVLANAIGSYEGTNIAVYAHLKDSYFMWQGTFVKVVADIAVGDTISSANTSITTVADAILNGSGGGETPSLTDLPDVNISSPRDGQILSYDNGQSKWKNSELPVKDVKVNGNSVMDSSGVAQITTPTVPSTLQDLSNVTISNPTNDQVLKYSTEQQGWINGDAPGGGGSGDNDKVTQTSTTSTDTDAFYEILFSESASDLTLTEGARKSFNLKFNPYLNSLQEGYQTEASGDYSHAEGSRTSASSSGSHSEGSDTLASGSCAHAEGYSTTSNGYGTHSEGYMNIAQSSYSHAEGFYTTATAPSAHSEGGFSTQPSEYPHGCLASNVNAHAEGCATLASGSCSHAEGIQTTASGEGSHSEGGKTSAYGTDAHAEGRQTNAYGYVSHAEGQLTIAGLHSHSEGYKTSASGQIAHAEGSDTSASGNGSHAEGIRTTAQGSSSHSEGYYGVAEGIAAHVEGGYDGIENNHGNYAHGNSSHAEGLRTTAYGLNSHAEGIETYAAGFNSSHAEGILTVATGLASHAEGQTATASGHGSHAEGGYDSNIYGGYGTLAYGDNAHAEGCATSAIEQCTHAGGFGTNSSNFAATAIGHFNLPMEEGGHFDDTEGTAFVIGNGIGDYVDDFVPSNAFSVKYDGTVKAAGTITGSTTADYAEYFEWADKNNENEDRIGYFVTFDNENKIRIATSDDDYILGVTSGCPFVLGNSDCDKWNGAFVRDKFNRIIYEVTATGGHAPVINSEYDPKRHYIRRADRPEWVPVGMLGVLRVWDDGTCMPNDYATVGENGIATISTNKSTVKYRVLQRIDSNVVEILFR